MSGFSEKQMEVLRFPYTKKKAIICDGSIRAGKSIAMLISYITSNMSIHNNMNFALCSKTVKTCERNIIKTIFGIKYLRENFKLKYNSKDSLLTITRGNKKNYFYVFGGKDESSYQLIQGITLAGVLFDEVALMPESFVNQAIGRCSVEGSKYWFNCNPEDPNHWFHIDWIKSPKIDTLYLHFTMEDNPSLSVETKERYYKMFSGVFFQRYIMGLWVKAEGIIYKKFAENTEQFILDTIPNDIIVVQVGVDFGGTNSGTTFVARAITKGFRTVGIIESVRYVDKQFKRPSPYDIIIEEMTPTILESLYVEFCKMVHNKYGRAFITRADSAEQVLIRGLRTASVQNHLHTDIKNAKKNVIKDRIKLEMRLMSEGRWWIARHCKTAIKAYSECLWSDKIADERLDDGTTDVDTLDASEYAIEEYSNSLIEMGGQYERE